MYDRALKLNPNDAGTYLYKGNKFTFFLGRDLNNLGKYEEAIIMYNHALFFNKNDAGTYYSKGKKFRFIFIRSCIRPFKKI